MKAAMEEGPSNLPVGTESGRVNRRRDVENEEVQMYLRKLKDLVPFMPKNRRLSKLEVIRYVTQYICELQYAIETQKELCGSSEEEEVEEDCEEEEKTTPSNTRQPLGTLAPCPNTIVLPCRSTSPLANPEFTARAMSPAELEKTQETDRPTSC